ncbi:SDR family NAD(P)-dependent oxidoreductase [Sediminibacterium goheungense]|uniref:NAD(P)-dependent dehydrogenase (Short-subunit alcohol dehydrogenase family) n=1 Tax=Sediminibacterium goheungense TaxID=1086393 RepID=A0A4R6J0J8_9BACT|nr:SDR family oxidoreductase [Sediminibacterium goheungense]TDO28261.1 NAD(P)-dependent dehydrogenase (short-subunit alcohol dehydrogenase family) [Sediminibacterium goheungense]
MTPTTKIALVTGGSRGLGKSMAIELAKKGLDLIITYQQQKTEAEKVVADIAATGRKAVAVALDVAKAETFAGFTTTIQQTLLAEFQTDRFDFLVNNAGSGVHADFAQTTEEQFDSMMNIHLKAPFFLTQHLLPLMNDGGGIVNISSGLTRFTYTGYDAYSTMKGGVETLTKYQAKFLGNRKIRVNVVAPGAIETDFGGGAVRDNQELKDYLSSLTSLGRVGVPDDVGTVVAFLCSDDAKWVNAQRIEVAGGIHI